MVFRSSNLGTVPVLGCTLLARRYKKFKEDRFETLQSSEKSLTKPKVGQGKSYSARKNEKETLLLFNGFVFHV